MTEYTSHKLRVLSALSILLVLYIHMFYVAPSDMKVLGFVQSLTYGAICRIAVPMFFVISGFFMFYSIPNGIRSFGPKIRKRIRTLLIPYVIVNTLTFAFYLSLSVICDYIPAIDAIVNFDVLTSVKDQSVIDTLKLVYVSPPIAYQLWFIRDLMIFVLFSPLLWLIFKLIPINNISRIVVFAILTILILIVGYDENSILWFIAGAFAAYARIDVSHVFKSPRIPIISFITLMILCLTFAAGIHFRNMISLIAIIGIITLWTGYDMFPSISRSQFIAKCTRYTFFVYLFHEPLLKIIKKIPLLFSSSELNMTISYITIPLVFFFIIVKFGQFLKKTIPSFYALYTGGR